MIGTTNELLIGLSDVQAASVLALGVRVRLSAGDTLFRLGDDADWLYSIEFGRIALMLPMHLRNRDEDVLVEERGPGQTLAWSALMPPHRLTMTAKALAETELLAIPRDELLRLIESQPSLGLAVVRNVMTVVSQRLQVLQFMWLREMQRYVSTRHA